MEARPIAVACAIAVAVASCVPSPAPAASTAPPRPVTVLTAPIGADLSPVTSNDSGTGQLNSLVYHGLLRADPRDATPRPALAESFGVSADGRTLTYTLRENVKWSDGLPVSPEDFSTTVALVMRSRVSVRKSVFQDIVGAQDFAGGKAPTIAGITSLGRTISVQLARPYCPALLAIGSFSILPKRYFASYLDPADASMNADAAPENRLPPAGTGPFVVTSRTPERIVLARNELFYGGIPKLDRVVVEVVADRAAQLAAMKAKAADVWSIVSLSADEREDLKRAASLLDVRSVTQLRYTYIAWNQLRGGKEFFQSKAVRQALAYGLNVDAVIDKQLGGDAIKMLAHTHPSLWAFDPSSLNEYRYDPRKATQLLEGEGWARGSDGVLQKGGQRLEFTLVTFDQNDTTALQREAVQQYAQVGIRVIPQTVTFSQLSDLLDKSRDPAYGAQGGRDVDAWIIRWVLGPDPDSYSIWHSSQIAAQNATGYRSAIADRALEDGRARCSLDERKAAYHALDLQLNEDQPYRFAFAPKAYFVTSKRLQGFEVATFSNLYTGIERWSVKE